MPPKQTNQQQVYQVPDNLNHNHQELITIQDKIEDGSASENVISMKQLEDTLDSHIKLTKLPVVRLGVTPSNGDCWFEACYSLVKHHDIQTTAKNAKDLREKLLIL